MPGATGARPAPNPSAIKCAGCRSRKPTFGAASALIRRPAQICVAAYTMATVAKIVATAVMTQLRRYSRTSSFVTASSGERRVNRNSQT